jgi:WD40 repeat protein
VLTYCGHVRFIRSLAWSPDGQYIVSGGEFGDSTVQVWQAMTGQRFFTHNTQYRIFSAPWSPNTDRIASGSFDGTVQIWDAFGNDDPLIYHAHDGPVYAVAWSPDGSKVVSAGQDTTIHTWSAQTGNTWHIYRGHTGAVKALSWSPDSLLIASGGDDTTVQIWSAFTRKPLLIYREHTSWVRAVAWSPDAEYVASASSAEVRVWRPGVTF